MDEYESACELSRSGRRQGYRCSQKLLLLLLLCCSSMIFGICVYWERLVLAPSYNLAKAFGNETTLAQSLEREVRILCWIITAPKYHKTRAVHIRRTWGRRCNKIYFMTSAHDDELETVVFNATDDYSVLWGKVKASHRYIFEHDLNNADWFLKADDDTYVFMENLRYMLYPYSPDMAIHFGFNFKMFSMPETNASYMSGGSGYVLSREAVRILVNGLNDSSKCRQENDHAEDVSIGECLHNLGVPAGDSRDQKLRNRFFPMAPFSTLISRYNKMDFWFFKYAYYNPRACMDCLSDYPVSFHYVDPAHLYVYDYFNYVFERYGRPQVRDTLPAKIMPENLFIPPSDNFL